MKPQPKDYQRTGIRLLTKQRNAALLDDAGLGKSLQMIRAANDLNADRILVTAPAIGRVSWVLQFAQWDLQPRPVYQYPADTAGLVPTGRCAIIVSQDWLSDRKKAKAFNKLLRLSERFDCGFHDEAHFLKNPMAQRTQAVYGRKDNTDSVSACCDRNWIASATLTPLNAGELYPHLRSLFPDLLISIFGRVPTLGQFQDRYCDVQQGTFGRKILGNKKAAIPELKNALAPYILSRRKTDVLTELDPIYSEALPLKIADKSIVKEAVRLLDQEPDQLSDDEFLRGVAMAYSDNAEYSTARRTLGELKVKPALQWIIGWLESNPTRKLVIFAHHTSVMEGIAKGLNESKSYVGGVSYINGRTPANIRADQVENFQTYDSIRVFLGQNKAAGTAITLTAASDVLLLEPDPSPENNYQAISRCHRIGQKSSVVARFGHVADNYIERRLASTLARRATDVSELFGSEQQGYIPNRIAY